VKGVRITCEDLETGDRESVEVTDDYVLTCVGSYYLAHTNSFRNGTVILTVKRQPEEARS
jgi:hypothetical protein